MPKDDKNFCSPDNLSVIMPYSDFVKLVEMGPKIDEMHRMYIRMCKQYDALKQMFGEMLDKVDEINRYL